MLLITGDHGMDGQSSRCDCMFEVHIMSGDSQHSSIWSTTRCMDYAWVRRLGGRLHSYGKEFRRHGGPFAITLFLIMFSCIRLSEVCQDEKLTMGVQTHQSRIFRHRHFRHTRLNTTPTDIGWTCRVIRKCPDAECPQSNAYPSIKFL